MEDVIREYVSAHAADIYKFFDEARKEQSMSQFSELLKSHFGDGQQRATDILQAYVGPAAKGIITTIASVIAMLDTLPINPQTKQTFVEDALVALIVQTIGTRGYRIPRSLVQWIVHELLVLLRIETAQYATGVPEPAPTPDVPSPQLDFTKYEELLDHNPQTGYYGLMGSMCSVYGNSETPTQWWVRAAWQDVHDVPTGWVLLYTT